MIHKLTLRNFKGIESAELAFERFTVLVGPNASGKTSVLQALDLLSAFADPDTKRAEVIQQYGGPASLKRGSHADLLVEAQGEWEGRSSALRMELVAQHILKVEGRWEGKLFAVPESVRQPRRRPVLDDASPPAAEAPRVVLNDWTAQVFLRLESRRLAEPSFAESIEPRIDTNGAGLASMLAQMALNRPDDFAKLLDALRSVIPQIVRVRLSLAEIKHQDMETVRIDDEFLTRHVTRNYPGHRILFDTQSGTGIPSEAASEGTLLVLGMLAALMASPRPRLMLLDDLDRGLHPKAQWDLVAQLRELLARDPDLQIIATSHSPYLLDHLEPQEIRLSTVLSNGTVRFAALTDHPDFERWKEAMRPGEFWSTVGERWVGERGMEPA